MSKSSFRSREEIRLEIERLEKKLANRKKKAELKEKRLHKISESNKVLQQKNLETKTEVVLDKSVGFKTSPDKDSGPLQENLDVSIIGSSQPTLPKNNVYRRRRSKRKSHSHDVLSKLKPIDVNRLSKWEDCNDSELEILNFKFKMPQPNFEMISQQSEFTLPKEFTRFKLECKRTRTVLNLEDDIDLEILSQSIFKSKRRRKSSWNPSEDDTVILANVEKETVAMMTENPDSVPINPILLDIETSYCPSGINVVTSDSDSTLPFNSVKKQDGLSKEAGNDLLVNESENDGKLADLNDFEISKNSEIAKPSRDEKVDFQFDEKRLTQQQQTSSSINLEEWSENFSHEILPVEMKSSLKNGCFVSVTEDQCVFHSNQGEEELLLKLHSSVANFMSHPLSDKEFLISYYLPKKTFSRLHYFKAGNFLNSAKFTHKLLESIPGKISRIEDGLEPIRFAVVTEQSAFLWKSSPFEATFTWNITLPLFSEFCQKLQL